jgi:hypothetical protein
MWGTRKELERWPQYRGRILQDGLGRNQIHLNVFTYFLFWMAFYVLRGSQTQQSAAPAHMRRYSHLTPSLGSMAKARAPSGPPPHAGQQLPWKAAGPWGLPALLRAPADARPVYCSEWITAGAGMGTYRVHCWDADSAADKEPASGGRAPLPAPAAPVP